MAGDLLNASWGSPNPLPRGGTHPAVEVVDVEGALPVLGGGVNPLPRGDSNPSVVAAGGVLESNRTVGEGGEGAVGGGGE